MIFKIKITYQDKFHNKIIFDTSQICEKISVLTKIKVLTNRSLIQFIPSIFEPLGLLNPVIVKLKILFQDACYEKFAWDDVLPQSYLSVIYNIVNGLREERKVLFERVYCIQTIEDLVVSIQFHAFVMPPREHMDVAVI